VPLDRALAYLDGFEVPTPDEGPLVVVDGVQSRKWPAT